MKTAVVTGVSSGIGKEIALRLLTLGYKVLGVSRTLQKDDFKEKKFIHVQADLSDEISTMQLIQTLQTHNNISLLVNAAGFGAFAPHEELDAKVISTMTFLNLTAPILLSNALLRTLKANDGYLVNINSIEALRSSKFAALYCATKAGLKAFGDALFEETRKSKLSICNINPDMTESNFYEHLRFDVSKDENEKLFTSDIADALEHILSMRKGAVVSEYTIRSLHFGIYKKPKS